MNHLFVIEAVTETNPPAKQLYLIHAPSNHEAINTLQIYINKSKVALRDIYIHPFKDFEASIQLDSNGDVLSYTTCQEYKNVIFNPKMEKQ
jgi:hypothetical protein